MGRLIDTDKITYQKNNHKGEIGYHFVMKNEIDNAPTVEAIPREQIDEMTTEILSRMWNCKGKHTTSIDKVKMEMLIREIIHKYCDKEQTDGNDD